MNYRPDLTGLRALAVAGVVLFHFGFTGIGGGFAGVDVFFVISGYLMTRIVVEGLASGSFSFAAFYRSRAKRIVPALVVVCIALFLFGLFFLGKRDFYALSKHVAASVLFISNFIYRNEAGYFDADSHEKWLLHTWSLSVEWQFYLLYPLVLVGISRVWNVNSRGFRVALWLLALASLMAALLTVGSRPVDTFFLLPTRAWELLAGGLVYLHAPKLRALVPGRLAEVSGAALIVGSFVFVSESNAWPGSGTLLPVLGTCLILLAEPRSWWLANPASQAVGKWSYSIYLWHWPLYVAATYFDWDQHAWSVGVLIMLSVVLGYLSYRFVEEPCRHSKFAAALSGRRLLFMAMPAVVLGSIGIATKGLPARLPEAVVYIESDPSHIRGNPAAWCDQTQTVHDITACLMGDPGMPPEVAVLGDSHAGALMGAIKQFSAENAIRVMAMPSAACPPIEGIRAIEGIPGEGCGQYIESSLAALEQTPSIRTVLLIARWSVYVEGYSETNGGPFAIFSSEAEQPGARRQEYHRKLVDSLCSMAARHAVYVVMPIPEHRKHVPREMARQLITRSAPEFPSISRAKYDKRNAVVLRALDEASQQCGVRLLDPRPYLCDENSCAGAIDGRPAYYDDDHLNEYGGALLTDMFRAIESKKSVWTVERTDRG